NEKNQQIIHAGFFRKTVRQHLKQEQGPGNRKQVKQQKINIIILPAEKIQDGKEFHHKPEFEMVHVIIQGLQEGMGRLQRITRQKFFDKFAGMGQQDIGLDF